MKNAPRSLSTQEDVVAGLTWTVNYGWYRTLVAGWLEITFGYENGEYKVIVAGRTLKARAKDVQSAAQLAVDHAKRLLQTAQTALTANPEPTTESIPEPDSEQY